MTIEELREQIERRLTEVREEVARLQAALDALGHGGGRPAAIDAAKPDGKPQPQRRRQSRGPRGTTRQAVLATLAGGDAMTAGQLAEATGAAARNDRARALQARQDRQPGQSGPRVQDRGAGQLEHVDRDSERRGQVARPARARPRPRRRATHPQVTHASRPRATCRSRPSGLSDGTRGRAAPWSNAAPPRAIAERFR